VSCLLERRRFYNEVLLSDLIALYQNTGLVVWGQIQGFPGTYQKLLVQADGTVVVTGTATVSGSVDVTDRSSRLLGIVYGSQNQQLLQRALTYDLLVTLRQSGAELSTSNPLFTGIVDASGNRMPSMDVSTRPGYVDVIDRAARLLGVPYGSQAQPLQQKATTYELLTDVIDRANRQLGYIYGSQNQTLQQKATTYELLVDVVDRAARLVGVVYGSQGQQLLQRASTYDLLVTLRQGGSELSTSNPVFAGIVDASGNRLPSMDVAARRGYVTVTDGTNTMPTMDTSTRAGYIDVVDRAGRLLGVVYGSQGQQIQQKATTYELLTDPVDRAARLLGVVYGSQGQQLLQRATTYDLIVQLRSGGSEINPQTIRALTTSDQITPIQTTRTNLTVKPEREDLTSYAALISPNGAGVQLIAGSGSLKIKVKKWGYQSTVAGQHFFYFGTSTTAPTLSATPTAKVFGVQFTAGTYRQTSTDPDVGAAGDGLYFYSANAESNMTVEWQSVQETP